MQPHWPHRPWCRTCTLPGCFRLPLPPANGLLAQVSSNVQLYQCCCLVIVGTSDYWETQKKVKPQKNMVQIERKCATFIIQVGTKSNVLLVLFLNLMQLSASSSLTFSAETDSKKLLATWPNELHCPPTKDIQQLFVLYWFIPIQCQAETKSSCLGEDSSWRMILSGRSHLFGDQTLRGKLDRFHLALEYSLWDMASNPSFRNNVDSWTAVLLKLDSWPSLAQPTDVAFKVISVISHSNAFDMYNGILNSNGNYYLYTKCEIYVQVHHTYDSMLIRFWLRFLSRIPGRPPLQSCVLSRRHLWPLRDCPSSGGVDLKSHKTPPLSPPGDADGKPCLTKTTTGVFFHCLAKRGNWGSDEKHNNDDRKQLVM